MKEYKCKICGTALTVFETGVFDDRHGYPGIFDIYRCNSCGFGQTVPELPEDKISDVYTQYYPRKEFIDVDELKNQPVQIVAKAKRVNVVRWWTGINNTAHLHIKKGTKVLDIGCGDCTSIREINSVGAEGYGIEPDQNIKAIVDALGLNVHVGLFHEIPYQDKFFDYITMSQVLEHIHNPSDLLQSFRRILKDDGQLIIGVPNVDSRLRKKYGRRWLNWHVPYHINHFSKQSLILLAEQSGYRVQKVRTITPNLWVDLQVRLFNYPVKEGVRVPFFNNESEPPHEEKPVESVSPYKHRFDYYKNKFKSKLIFRQFNIAKVLLLRLFDYLGLGESFLIVLTKK